MGDSLEVVALSVREIVHRVGVPLVAGTDMGDVEHTVDQRVAEQHVRMGHINLGAKYQRAWFAFAAVHELKEAQVLFDGTVAERTVGSRAGRRTLLLGDDL